MNSTQVRERPWLLSLAYMAGVVLSLTAVAAMLTYVIDPEAADFESAGFESGFVRVPSVSPITHSADALGFFQYPA